MNKQQSLEAELPPQYQKVLFAIRHCPGLVISCTGRFAYLRSLAIYLGTIKHSEIRKTVYALAKMRLIFASKPEFAEQSEPPRWYDSYYKLPVSSHPKNNPFNNQIHLYVDESQQTC